MTRRPLPKPAPVVLHDEPPEATPADELAEALRGMVNAAVAAGGRDRPDVVHAQAVLAKLETSE